MENAHTKERDRSILADRETGPGCDFKKFQDHMSGIESGRDLGSELLCCRACTWTNISSQQQNTKKLEGTKPGTSAGKESACNAGNPGSIPGLGRSSAEGNSYPFQYSCLRLAWTEEPGGLPSIELQRVRHDSAANTFTFLDLIEFV